MHPLIAQHQERIASVCRSFGVRRLEVFGSAAGFTDFDVQRSDIDFLVEFRDDIAADLNLYFETKSALEQVLGRPVDLVEPSAIRNPYLMDSINQQRKPVYAA